MSDFRLRKAKEPSLLSNRGEKKVRVSRGEGRRLDYLEACGYRKLLNHLFNKH